MTTTAFNDTTGVRSIRATKMVPVCVGFTVSATGTMQTIIIGSDLFVREIARYGPPVRSRFNDVRAVKTAAAEQIIVDVPVPTYARMMLGSIVDFVGDLRYSFLESNVRHQEGGFSVGVETMPETQMAVTASSSITALMRRRELILDISSAVRNKIKQRGVELTCAIYTQYWRTIIEELLRDVDKFKNILLQIAKLTGSASPLMVEALMVSGV